MSSVRPIIVELLRNIGGRKEVGEYLRYYAAQKLAVIALTETVHGEQLRSVAAALSFLNQVGLETIVVHGSDERALRDAIGDQLRLVHAEAPLDAALALSEQTLPHKLVLLSAGGGISDQSGQLISAINLADGGTLDVNVAAQKRIEQIAALLKKLPSTSSVSITSPDHLARELFTHRGAGTLVRLGEQVQSRDSFEGVDTARLRELLETCFGRALAGDYFQRKRCRRVYVTSAYRATAIVTDEAGTPYLDKFAVTRKAQGEGLGGSVWSRLRADHPRLFWRAQPGNAINGWYFKQADGSFKNEHWVVFWYGLEGFSEIQRCIEAAIALPPTLRDHGTDA